MYIYIYIIIYGCLSLLSIFRSDIIDCSQCLSIIFTLDIIFIAYCFAFNLHVTRHTLLNPPFPITLCNSNELMFTMFTSHMYNMHTQWKILL
jgi:hypothetical protein